MFFSKGCQTILLYEQFVSHLTSCEFAMYKCLTSQQCSFQGMKDEVLAHVKLCMMIKCQYCSIQISKNEVNSHSLMCGNSLVACPTCRITGIQRKEFFLHNSGVCFENLLNMKPNNTTNTGLKNEDNEKLLQQIKQMQSEIKSLYDRNTVMMKEKFEVMNEVEIAFKEKRKIQELLDSTTKEKAKLREELDSCFHINKNHQKEKETYENNMKALTYKIENLEISAKNNKNKIQTDKCSHTIHLWHLKAIQAFCFFCGKSDYCRFKCGECYKFYCRFCKPVPKQNMCPIGHGIILKRKLQNYYCDICFTSYQAGSYTWNDVNCDLDICIKCWPVPRNSAQHSDVNNIFDTFFSNLK